MCPREPQEHGLEHVLEAPGAVAQREMAAQLGTVSKRLSLAPEDFPVVVCSVNSVSVAPLVRVGATLSTGATFKNVHIVRLIDDASLLHEDHFRLLDDTLGDFAQRDDVLLAAQGAAQSAYNITLTSHVSHSTHLAVDLCQAASRLRAGMLLLDVPAGLLAEKLNNARGVTAASLLLSPSPVGLYLHGGLFVLRNVICVLPAAAVAGAARHPAVERAFILAVRTAARLASNDRGVRVTVLVSDLAAGPALRSVTSASSLAAGTAERSTSALVRRQLGHDSDAGTADGKNESETDAPVHIVRKDTKDEGSGLAGDKLSTTTTSEEQMAELLKGCSAGVTAAVSAAVRDDPLHIVVTRAVGHTLHDVLVKAPTLLLHSLQDSEAARRDSGNTIVVVPKLPAHWTLQATVAQLTDARAVPSSSTQPGGASAAAAAAVPSAAAGSSNGWADGLPALNMSVVVVQDGESSAEPHVYSRAQTFDHNRGRNTDAAYASAGLYTGAPVNCAYSTSV